MRIKEWIMKRNSGNKTSVLEEERKEGGFGYRDGR